MPLVNLNLETVTCDPLMCTMSHTRIIVSNKMEEFISIQGVKACAYINTDNKRFGMTLVSRLINPLKDKNKSELYQ